MVPELDYAEIQSYARNISRRIAPGVHLDANDLAQEACLRGLMGRKSIMGPMFDLLRRERSMGITDIPGYGNRNVWIVKTRVNDWLPVFRYMPEYGRREIPREVRERFDALDARSRHLLHLLYWEGFSQTEAAFEMGVSEGLVSQLKSAALKNLKGTVQ